MSYWLLATHLKSGAKSRAELQDMPLIVGRATADFSHHKMAIDFDPMLSRSHFKAILEGQRLRIRALENRHPIYLRGQVQSEFVLDVGQHFTSGQTAFEFAQMEPSLGNPTRSNTLLFDLSRLRELDSERCLNALLELQPLLASGKAAPEMLSDALPILAKIIPMASVILAISAQEENYQTLASQGADQHLAPSRTLLRQAVTTEESICYFWDHHESTLSATMVADVRWAVAAPIPSGGSEVFVLYAVGSESPLTTSSGRTPGDLDRAVLTFVARVLGQHFKARWAAQQFEEERRQRYLAQTLSEILAALTSTLEPHQIVSCLLQYLQKLVGFDASQFFSEDQGVAAGQLRGSDAELAPLNLEWPGDPWVLCLPLKSRQQDIGLLVLSRHQASFTPDEQSLATSLCAQASVALENAHMFKTVERLATVDELTQIYNRRHFFREAETLQARASQEGSPLSVLLLDIDHFKSFNDTHGHQTGDRVLQIVASRANTFFTSPQVLGRYGGEEFAAVAPCSLEAMTRQAEALRQAIEREKLEFIGGQVGLTISVGVAACSLGQTPVQTLLGVADEALYKAKRGGRNRVCQP